MELALVTAFLIKHTLADYFLQYSWMIKHKGTYGHWKGMAHSELHGFFTWLLLFYFGFGFFWALLMGLLDTVLHYHIDYVKSNVWKTKGYTAQDQMYWITHGTDQLLHLLTYVLIIWISL